MEVPIRFSTLLRSVLVLVVVVAASGARNSAGQEPLQPSVEQLLAETLEDVGGRQLAVTRLVYPPGLSAMPHRHQAYLAVYVVSGQVESALGDEEPILYGPGDSWYESHMQLHREFRNPSTTVPATVIVFALRDADHPANARGSDADGR